MTSLKNNSWYRLPTVEACKELTLHVLIWKTVGNKILPTLEEHRASHAASPEAAMHWRFWTMRWPNDVTQRAHDYHNWRPTGWLAEDTKDAHSRAVQVFSSESCLAIVSLCASTRKGCSKPHLQWASKCDLKPTTLLYLLSRHLWQSTSSLWNTCIFAFETILLKQQSTHSQNVCRTTWTSAQTSKGIITNAEISFTAK